MAIKPQIMPPIIMRKVGMRKIRRLIPLSGDTVFF